MKQPNSQTNQKQSPEGYENTQNFHLQDLDRRRRCSEVGIRIKKEREAQGMSQVRLAALSGFSSGYLCDIENRRSNPSLMSLMAFADVLGKPVSSFMGEGDLSLEAKEEGLPFGLLEERDRRLLSQLIREPGFLEIIRAMQGFDQWEEHEKIELMSLLDAKRKSRIRQQQTEK